MPQADGHLLRMIATGAAIFTAGSMGTVSLMTVPAFLDAPARVAQTQFRRIYSIGLVTQPPLTAITTCLMGCMWYEARKAGQSQAANLWLASTAAMGAILPFTFALIERVSWAINDYRFPSNSTTETPTADLELKTLLRRWSTLNMVRTVFALSAGSFSLWTFRSQ